MVEVDATQTRWGRVAPTRALCAGAGVLVAIGVLDLAIGIHERWASDAWLFVLAAALATAVFDYLWSRRAGRLLLDRKVGSSLVQDRPAEVQLAARNLDATPMVVSFAEHLPDGFQTFDWPIEGVIPPSTTVVMPYRVRPLTRGSYQLNTVSVRRRSRLGLWSFGADVPLHSEVRVYPDFGWMHRVLELLSDRRVAQLGIKIQPRRGEGLEFHQLREYQAGDSIRHIDWKATARRTKLISRQFQEERDQQLVFLLDTGRRMRTQDGELSHFDHALRAVLLLAHIAIRQGDAVGLMSFGTTRRWSPLRKGGAAGSALLNSVYDLHSGPAASDYVSAATELSRLQRKRALVVLVTSFGEEDEDLLTALSVLRRRHLVVVANLRERVLQSADGVADIRGALRESAAALVRQRRRRLARAIANQGYLLLDTTPEELPIRLVNDYWRVKRSGAL